MYLAFQTFHSSKLPHYKQVLCPCFRLAGAIFTDTYAIPHLKYFPFKVMGLKTELPGDLKIVKRKCRSSSMVGSAATSTEKHESGNKERSKITA